MNEQEILFDGFQKTQGYRVYCRGADIQCSLLNVKAERSVAHGLNLLDKEWENTVGIGGDFSHIGEIPEKFNSDLGHVPPFDAEIRAYNVLEKRDYKLMILGIEFVPGTNSQKYIAQGVVTWLPIGKGNQ